MTEQTRAHITLVVDRSGSMATTRADAEGGIAEFLKRQAELRDTHDVIVTVSMHQFNQRVDAMYRRYPVSGVMRYAMQPSGMTALYDAIGRGIDATREDLGELNTGGPPVEKVVIVVVTDGHENSSQEHTYESITKMIEDQKNAGWEFVFLGADLDVVEKMANAGMTTTRYDATERGTRVMYGTTGQSVHAYLGGTTRSVEMPSEAIDDQTTKAQES